DLLHQKLESGADPSGNSALPKIAVAEGQITRGVSAGQLLVKIDGDRVELGFVLPPLSGDAFLGDTEIDQPDPRGTVLFREHQIVEGEGGMETVSAEILEGLQHLPGNCKRLILGKR